MGEPTTRFHSTIGKQSVTSLTFAMLFEWGMERFKRKVHAHILAVSVEGNICPKVGPPS